MRPASALPRGFTLTELLVVLAIAGILAMAGTPMLGGLLARSRVASVEGTIAGSLRHARTLAVMHNTRVLVCPAADTRHCRSDGNWQHGLLVVADADHDGQPDPGAHAVDLSASPPPGTRIITSIGRRQVVFHPDGSAAGSNLRFTICHAGETSGKSVVVSNSGRVRIDTPSSDRLQQCLAGMP